MITPEIRKQYEVVVGLETHVQLKTKTKLFCGCDNDAREAEPNTKVCPVCLGLPGTLPVLNEQAIKLAIRAGLALNGEIAQETKFDRKNYFYPDLPKGYQITQFDQPIVGKGYVEAPLNGKLIKIGITRAHLEEDAGKLTHPTDADYSLVDLNRAGTPLLEIVSEPDIRSAAEAKAYAQEVYNLMRYADVSEANLYYGNMRFDVNVSVRKVGAAEFGTRTETKNLNSFRSIEKTVEYETIRQIEQLEKGEKIVQETRGWDDVKQRTFSQRSKEEAHDYRYFPEPDVPPVVVTEKMLADAKDSLGIRPSELRSQLLTVGAPAGDIETLIDNAVHAHLVTRVDAIHAKRIAGWLVNELAGEDLSSFDRTTDLEALSQMVADNKLSSTSAKEVLHELLKSDETPEEIAERLNLIQVSDSGELSKIVTQVIAENPQSVQDYKSGKAQALGFLVGRVMKASKGQANPPMVNELLRKELDTQ
jgi:aspartyl-tRNA(Asn)/glutamyl-tRNA(Gln) amidotransferase subunit B